MCYDADKLTDIRPPLAAGGGPAFQQQAGERRRRASSLQLASPPVATRNGLACLLLKCAILPHKFCHTTKTTNAFASNHHPTSKPQAGQRPGQNLQTLL